MDVRPSSVVQSIRTPTETYRHSLVEFVLWLLRHVTLFVAKHCCHNRLFCRSELTCWLVVLGSFESFCLSFIHLGVKPFESPTGATVLLCTQIDKDAIQLLGHWKSNVMLQSLCIQAMMQTPAFSQCMLDNGSYTYAQNACNDNPKPLPQQTPASFLALLNANDQELKPQALHQFIKTEPTLFLPPILPLALGWPPVPLHWCL